MNIPRAPRSIGTRLPASLTLASALFLGLVHPPIASGSPPQQFNLTVLSADLDDSEIPLINGDNVVWIGTHGTERDLYRYHIPSSTRSELTVTTVGLSAVAIDGNYVVWEDVGIKLQDLTTGSTFEISTEPRSSGPRIDGKNVVWLEGRAQDSQRRLMRYNIDTLASQQLIDYSGFHNIRISGNDIVWDRRTGSAPTTAEIFHYSLVTGVTTRLTTNSIPDAYPEVSAGNVIWQTFDTESTSEVFRRNLQTGITQQLTSNSSSDRTPEISGNNVVWQGPGNNVSYRNLATGVTTQLTDSTGYPKEFGEPRVSGSNAMWFGTLTQGGWEEVFYHNLADGTTTQVTNNTIKESYGDLSGQSIAFLRVRSLQTNKWDVVLATPIPEPSTALLIGVAGAIAFLRAVRQLRTR